MRNLSWVAANLAPPNVSIVDSRSPEVYAGSAEKKTGHIPGAINRFWMDDLEKEGGALRSRAELDQAYAAIG
jgi:thiosulfate/3-mercaptopyruvate sulfurtransferase